MRFPIFSTALFLSAVGAAVAVFATEDSLPVVKITSPEGGWSSQRIVHVRGTVTGASVTRAALILNGAPQFVAVREGSFDVEQVLSPGPNVIQVWAETPAGAGRDAVVVHSQVPPTDLKVTLVWDTDGTDVDLWVTDPKGEKCFYEHKETALSGRLDTDVTDGYGPETFTLAAALPGNYVIEACFYGDNGRAQTRCRATVVLYEGTPAEERRSFDFVLSHAGDLARIAALPVGAHR